MDKERTIFISYRREDSAHAAGRLYDRLSQHFGPDRIFMDIDTIELGDDFVNAIETAVRSCDVLVSIIGNRWLSVINADGKRRLDDPNDFVRLEVVSALGQGVDVIPILVDGAGMPQVGDLPEVLFSLTRRNGLVLDHTSFNADVDRLIRGIEAIFTARAARDIVEVEMANPVKLVADQPRNDQVAADKKTITKVQNANLIKTNLASTTTSEDISIETRRLILLIVTLGWLISGIVFGVTYLFDIIPSLETPLIPAVLGGVAGVLVIGIPLKRMVPSVRTETLVFLVIGWVIGIAIGWSSSFSWGDIQLEAGIPLGGMIGGFIVGLTISYGLSKIFGDLFWNHFVIISIGWSIAWAIGLIINYQLYSYYYDYPLLLFFFPYLLTTAILGVLLFWQTGRLGRQ